MTAHPSGSWAAEIVRRAATSEKCRYLMRDRDPIYAGLFSDAARSVGLRQMVSAPRTPVMNPYAERVIGTLRRECLDHAVVLG